MQRNPVVRGARNVLAPWVVAVAAVFAPSATASAQPIVLGSFNLPYEVQWGKAVLAAGSYTVTIDSFRGPAIVRTSAGEGVALVTARSIDDRATDQPTALLITGSEGRRVVRSLHWREGGTVFTYVPFTEAESSQNFMFRKEAGNVRGLTWVWCGRPATAEGRK